MSRGVAVVGLDSAGGAQLGNQFAGWTVEGQTIVGIGDTVASHGLPPHSPPPPMVEGADWFTIDGIPVCRAGDAAACGHTTTGRSWFTID
ncbi:MAG: hypothetical protein LC676_10685 [Loktanella sp.]|nr:hypothetical protein [Loktanella sp.]